MTTPATPTDTAAPAAPPPAEASDEKKPTPWREQISPEVKADIAARRARNEVVAQIAQTNWGKGLDIHTARAVADWAFRYNIDAAQEIDVLGGSIYLNARFYLNRLSKLIQQGVVEYAIADHINADARLLAMASDEKLSADMRQQASRELHRRAMERIFYNAPEDAKAIVIFRVKLRNTPVEFAGCKWTGTGRRKKNDASKYADPVGEEYPVETAETRAARRACRLLVSHIPEIAQWIEAATDDAVANVDEKIAAAIDSARTKQSAIAEGSNPHRMLQLPEGDPYFVATPAAESEKQPVEAKVEPEPEKLGVERPEPEPPVFQDDRDIMDD